MAEYYRCKEGFAYPDGQGGMIVVAADSIVDGSDAGYKQNPDAFESVSKTAEDAVTRKSGKKAAPVEAATAAPGEKRAASVPKK